MIGADLEGADLENRVASWAASAASDETQPARLRQLFVLERTGGHWKITQYMPEQSGGGCSGI